MERVHPLVLLDHPSIPRFAKGSNAKLNRSVWIAVSKSQQCFHTRHARVMITPPLLLRCLSCSLRCEICLTFAPVHCIEHRLTLGQSFALLKPGGDTEKPLSFNSTQESYRPSAELCDLGQETLHAAATPVFISEFVNCLPGREADFCCDGLVVIDELLSTFAAATDDAAGLHC